jgi:hypothetical protein
MPDDMQGSLREVLSAPRPTVTVQYGGTGFTCRGPYSRSAGYLIILCQKVFLPEKDTAKPRLPAVLFHELIHIVGGWELDAEAFENAWFSQVEGARQPTADDWVKFKRHRYEGWWVRVDPGTGLVTDYARRTITTLNVPDSHRARRRSRRPS